MVRVLKRGNWMDETVRRSAQRSPRCSRAARSGCAADTARSGEVACLAREPMTARATTNRLWKLFFGAGLSRKLDDLGGKGSGPAIPSCWTIWPRGSRDWLGPEADGEDVVMTRAYRQSSGATPELMEADPYNRWLARQGRFRLDAEMVRDNALSISGLLVEKVGGKSVRPYQPPVTGPT